MNKTYQDWLNYYKNATIEQIIEDVMMDNVKIKELKEENNQLKTKLKIKEEMVKIKDEAINDLLEENRTLRTRIKTIKRRRKNQTQKLKNYKLHIINIQNALTEKNNKIDKAIETIESWHFALDWAENDRLKIIKEILKDSDVDE